MRAMALALACVLLTALFCVGMAGRGPSGQGPSAQDGQAFKVELAGTRSGMRNGEELKVFFKTKLLLGIKLESAHREGIRYALEIPLGAAVKLDLHDADKGPFYRLGQIEDFREVGTNPMVVLAYRYLFHVQSLDHATLVTFAVPAPAWNQWSVAIERGKWTLLRHVDAELLASLGEGAAGTSAVDVLITVDQGARNENNFMTFRLDLPWPPEFLGQAAR